MTRKFETKIVLVFLIFALIGSIANFAYFYGTLRPYSEIYFPTDFDSGLLSFRFLVILCLIGCLTGILLKSIVGKTVSVLSVLIILAFYVLWYFEKFKWIHVVGINEGTPEYLKTIDEIGWFRGANEWDLVMLLFVLALMLWVIFRYKTRRPKSLQ